MTEEIDAFEQMFQEFIQWRNNWKSFTNDFLISKPMKEIDFKQYLKTKYSVELISDTKQSDTEQN